MRSNTGELRTALPTASRNRTMTSSETNCVNCGAPMELVASGRYFRCPHCGTYHFHQTAEAEGIRIVGTCRMRRPVPSAVRGWRTRSSTISIRSTSARSAGVCCCRGKPLPVTNTRRAWATTSPAEPVPLNRKDLTRELLCPKCHRKFETHPHYGPGNVVIDNCTACDLVWFGLR